MAEAVSDLVLFWAYSDSPILRLVTTACHRITRISLSDGVVVVSHRSQHAVPEILSPEVVAYQVTVSDKIGGGPGHGDLAVA